MKTTKTSDLFNSETYRLVGFTHTHIVESENRAQITFFHEQGGKHRYLMCLSTIREDHEKQFRRMLKKQLGNIVHVSEVIPYAQRAIEGATFEQFKEIMNEAFDKKISWWVP